MSFQQTVSGEQGFGVVGEIFTNGPLRSESVKLVSGTAINTVGNAYTITAEGVAKVGGDAGVFGGILINPKHYASYGTSSGTLEASLVLPENAQGELLTMGEIIVSLSNAAVIGSGVYYTDATGVLGCGTASTGQTQIENCFVSRFATSGAGLAVIKITQ
jgi:hypothetical protein